MTTAIIGVGNIGRPLARHLVRGGEQVMLAAREESNAAALAGELGRLASAATVQEAIEAADVVVFAVWFDALKQLIAENADLLDGKVVADPSNPIGFSADGTPFRILPQRPVAGLPGGGDAARRRPLRQGARYARRLWLSRGVPAGGPMRGTAIAPDADDPLRPDLPSYTGIVSTGPVMIHSISSMAVLTCACIPGSPTCSRPGLRRSSSVSRACLRGPSAARR